MDTPNANKLRENPRPRWIVDDVLPIRASQCAHNALGEKLVQRCAQMLLGSVLQRSVHRFEIDLHAAVSVANELSQVQVQRQARQLACAIENLLILRPLTIAPLFARLVAYQPPAQIFAAPLQHSSVADLELRGHHIRPKADLLLSAQLARFASAPNMNVTALKMRMTSITSDQQVLTRLDAACVVLEAAYRSIDDKRLLALERGALLQIPVYQDIPLRGRIDLYQGLRIGDENLAGIQDSVGGGLKVESWLHAIYVVDPVVCYKRPRGRIHQLYNVKSMLQSKEICAPAGP